MSKGENKMAAGRRGTSKVTSCPARSSTASAMAKPIRKPRKKSQSSKLQWGNISLRKKTIRITATLQRLRDTDMAGSTRTRIAIGTPKSDTSVRTIPMTDYAAALCRENEFQECNRLCFDWHR